MAPQYKLTYFDFKAFGEPIRFLLSYLNVEFEDKRLQFEEWPSIKPTTPFGKVPILEIDGKVMCQSTAIARYLGRKAGLAGKDDWEDLMIDMAVDVFGDFMKEISSCVREKDEVLRNKKTEILIKETIPFYFSKLDQLVKENDGHVANKKLSWGDIWVASLIDATQDLVEYSIADYSNLIGLRDTIFSIPSIKSWIDKRPPPRKPVFPK